MTTLHNIVWDNIYTVLLPIEWLNTIYMFMQFNGFFLVISFRILPRLRSLQSGLNPDSSLMYVTSNSILNKLYLPPQRLDSDSILTHAQPHADSPQLDSKLGELIRLFAWIWINLSMSAFIMLPREVTHQFCELRFTALLPMLGFHPDRSMRNRKCLVSLKISRLSDCQLIEAAATQ